MPALTAATLPRWKSRAEFDAWWLPNVRDINRLSVQNPDEWERITQRIEAFWQKHRGY